ncbi:MAG: hypothetical protein ACRDUX_22810, partial [Mycobacterium sp.]
MICRILMCAVVVSTTMTLPGDSRATVVSFTGGTVTLLDATTETTDNDSLWEDVDFYEEGGFRLDFVPNAGSAGISTNIGNYYDADNDVIHAHWATGEYGDVVSIEITKIGGGTFDLNYFVLTSNTDEGGSPASGNEQAFVEGFNNSVSTGPPVMLPSEDWGFPGTAVYLGSAFDAVDKVVFTAANPVDCFGMDEFFIDEPAPPPTCEIRNTCRSAGKSILLLKNNTSDDSKDKLIWKWLKGAGTTLGELGTPNALT